MAVAQEVVVEASVRDPERLRELLNALATVSSASNWTIQDQTLFFSGINTPQTYQLWLQMDAAMLFDDFMSQQDQTLQVNPSTFEKALRIYDGSEDVLFRMTTAGARARNITLKTTDSAGGSRSMIVRQRVVANVVEEIDLPVEPQVGQLQIFCELSKPVLAQMTRVVDKYQNLSTNLSVQISRFGSVALSISPNGADITTTWDVDIPELEEDNSTRLSQLGASQGSTDESSTVTVSCKDWLDMLSIRKYSRRVILGLRENHVAVVFGYIRHDDLDGNVATYYLSQAT